VGKRRVFASAADWPGWGRSGKDETSAMEALANAQVRYAAVPKAARIAFAPTAGFDVVERLPGESGESTADVHRRVTAALDDIVARHSGERVIVVSHGWALTMLFAAVQNWDYVEAFREQRLQFGNTSVSVVEIGADGSRTCTLLNCTRYLPETAGSDCNP